MQDDNSWPLPLSASQVTYVWESQEADICHHTDSEIWLSPLFHRSAAAASTLASGNKGQLAGCHTVFPGRPWCAVHLGQFFGPGRGHSHQDDGKAQNVFGDQDLHHCQPWKGEQMSCFEKGYYSSEEKSPPSAKQCISAIGCYLWILCSSNWGLLTLLCTFHLAKGKKLWIRLFTWV